MGWRQTPTLAPLAGVAATPVAPLFRTLCRGRSAVFCRSTPRRHENTATYYYDLRAVDAEALYAARRIFQLTQLALADYTAGLVGAQPGDWVYCDPPICRHLTRRVLRNTRG